MGNLMWRCAPFLFVGGVLGVMVESAASMDCPALMHHIKQVPHSVTDANHRSITPETLVLDYIRISEELREYWESWAFREGLKDDNDIQLRNLATRMLSIITLNQSADIIKARQERELDCYSTVRHEDGFESHIHYVMERNKSGIQYWQYNVFFRDEWECRADEFRRRLKKGARMMMEQKFPAIFGNRL